MEYYRLTDVDVASMQLPDGSFQGDQWGEVDTRFVYSAIQALRILGRLEKINVDKTVEWIQKCYNFDGGYGLVPGAESHAAQSKYKRQLDLQDYIG